MVAPSREPVNIGSATFRLGDIVVGQRHIDTATHRHGSTVDTVRLSTRFDAARLSSSGVRVWTRSRWTRS